MLMLQLFGYFQSEGDDQELTVGEDVSVFMVGARRRVGDAAGEPFVSIVGGWGVGA